MANASYVAIGAQLDPTPSLDESAEELELEDIVSTGYPPVSSLMAESVAQMNTPIAGESPARSVTITVAERQRDIKRLTYQCPAWKTILRA